MKLSMIEDDSYTKAVSYNNKILETDTTILKTVLGSSPDEVLCDSEAKHKKGMVLR